MAYAKNDPVWAEGVAPGISAARLTHLETQYDEAAADDVIHAALDTGVHGAGASTLATVADLEARLPSGAIVMWHGTIANIPAGWVICDGNNDTPNLLARFVQGVATAATNPGATGGATAKNTGSGTTSQECGPAAGSQTSLDTHTHSITDVRPLYYDIAFIMKT